MYHATADNFYLIPTAEVPVTNVYRDTIVKEADLPIKMTSYSHCFRREAGSFGKDVRGLNRVHQFEKAEIVQELRQQYSFDGLLKLAVVVVQGAACNLQDRHGARHKRRFEFDRTISRLQEMRSADYLALGHGED